MEISKGKIIEGNLLIAEFMGEIVNKEPIMIQGIQVNTTPNGLNYHRSWDWLMPAVHKCWDMSTEDEQAFAGLVLFEIGIFTPKEEVWQHVVDFVKWHNSKLERK